MSSGGGSSSRPPATVVAAPATPKKTDQTVAKAEETELRKAKRAAGARSTILSSGLSQATVQRTTLLGGNV